MCLLAILYRVCADAPVVVGANREEYFARGGDPPRRLDIAAVGGVDPAHGGTWLGVNARGVLIAVTNRAKTHAPPSPRSRGLLARELLALPSASAAAAHAARALDWNRYAGCNLLCADADSATVIHGGDWLRVRPLPAGVHVLSNRDVNDPTDRRAVFAGEWLARRDLRASGVALDELATLCRSHEPAVAPLCFRDQARGAVSSSLVALRPELRESAYLHAQGPPDVTPYADVSHLLRELADAGETP